MSKYHNLDSNDVNINFRINLMSTSSFSDEIVVSVFEEQIKKNKTKQNKKDQLNRQEAASPSYFIFYSFCHKQKHKGPKTRNNPQQ